MNMFRAFESRVAGVFGASKQGTTAPFSFKKLAKRAARELEQETYIIDGINTAPALITVLVSPADDAAMRPVYGKLATEIADLVEAEAAHKGYVFIGKPLARFIVDNKLKAGHFAVFANNVDAATLEKLREEEEAFLAGYGTFGGAASPASPSIVTPIEEPVATQTHGQEAYQPFPAPEAGDSAVGLNVMPADFEDEPLDLVQPEAPSHAAPVMPAAPAPAAAAPAMPQVAQPVAPQVSQPVAPQPAVPAPIAADPAAVATMAPAVPQPAAVEPRPISEGLPEVVRPGTPIVTPVPEVVGAHVAQMPEVAAAPAAMAVPGVTVPHVPNAQDSTAGITPVPVVEESDPVTCLLIDRQSGRTYIGTEPETIIGRERTPRGIVLHDPNVSRHHCKLLFDGRSWSIQDMNSTNGTLVNDMDVDSCVLRDGDIITLGLLNLEFRES